MTAGRFAVAPELTDSRPYERRPTSVSWCGRILRCGRLRPADSASFRCPADAGLATHLYETVHGLAPTVVDCRPIDLGETLLEAGFRIEAERTGRSWRLPVEVVRYRPA